jgi:hypothetical protein
MQSLPTGVDLNGNPITFDAILGRDHRMHIANQLEDSSGNVLSQQFGIEDGDVTLDRTAAVRRSCSLKLTAFGAAGTVTDPQLLEQLAETLIPDDDTDAFAPYGNKIRLWYRIEVPGYVHPLYGDNLYPFELGVFRLSTVDVSDDGTPTLSITGYDDSKYISKNKTTVPWIVAAGTNYGAAIIAFCQDRLPGLQANPHTVTQTTPQIVVDAESDPWQTVTDWASAIGCEVFIDRYGLLTVRDEPDPQSDPVVWVYDDGTTNPNAVLLNVNRGMSDDPGYNGIVLTSESNTLPAQIRIELWDDDPDSPTYALGPYGKVPYFKSSPLVTDYTGGGAMAASELLKVMGGTESSDFAVIPNPAHEPGDVVRLVRPLSKENSTVVLDSMVVPLSAASPMTIRCKERRSSLQVSGTLL